MTLATLMIAIGVLSGQTANSVHQSIPPEAFTIKVDGFKQVVGCVVDCGTLPGEITALTTVPALPADAGFKFIAGEKSFTLSLPVVGKPKKRSIEPGGYTWDGSKLTWSLRTFPEADVGKAIAKVRDYLASCAVVATLADGTFVQLSPPGVEVSGKIGSDRESVIRGSLPFKGLTPDSMLTVVSSSADAWKDTASGRGILRGKLSDIAFEISAADGELSIQELEPRRIKLRNLQQQLASDRALLPTIKESQRAILAADCETLAAEIAALSKEVEEALEKSITASIKVRAAHPLSGRVFGEATLEITR